MGLLGTPATTVVVHRAPVPADPAVVTSTLDAIRARGSLRVGYLPDSLPYAFFNARGDLVGYDVELANRLAIELGVRLELVPVTRDDPSFNTMCDLVMSGVAVTTDRASQMLFSDLYLDETLGLLVPDHARDRFGSWAEADKSAPVTIGVPNVPYFVEGLRQLMPHAQFQPLRTVDEVFADNAAFDAVALPAERGSAWTLLHPDYSMVVPEGALIKVPLAYPIARRDAAFATFVNTWIELKRKDGTLDRLFKYLDSRAERRAETSAVGIRPRCAPLAEVTAAALRYGFATALFIGAASWFARVALSMATTASQTPTSATLTAANAGTVSSSRSPPKTTPA